jgi:hypothetical protein
VAGRSCRAVGPILMLEHMTRLNLILVAASLALAGCQPANVDKFPDPGHVIAHVVDQTSAPVAGANVQLLIPGTTLAWRSAISDATGNAVPGQEDGGVLPGDYLANIVPPQGLVLSATQPNPVAITIESNKTINVTFQLSRQ